MNLKFKCSKCGHTVLESVEKNVTIGTVLIDIDDSGDFEYGEQDIVYDDNIVDRFQCLSCGFVIKDVLDEPIINVKEVAEWIKSNCSQSNM